MKLSLDRRVMSKTIKQIKELMYMKGITHERMSVIIDVTPVTMHRWMNGTRTPNIEYVERMALVLGMQVGLIYKGER